MNTETVTLPAELLRDLLRTIELNNDCAERHAHTVGQWTRNTREAIAELAAFLPEPVEPPTVAPAPVRKPRPSNAPQPIRRCVAICKEFGLDFRDEAGRRAAASKLFGRELASCQQMSLADWGELGNAIKFRGLRWQNGQVA